MITFYIKRNMQLFWFVDINNMD